MSIFYTFQDIDIDKDRHNAISYYERDIKNDPDLTPDEKFDAKQDLIRLYIQRQEEFYGDVYNT